MAGSKRTWRRIVAVMTGVVAASASVVAVFAVTTTSAFAASSPYELYCPGTPVGDIVLNNVVTSGTITPAAPATGAQFNLTGYQSTVALPTSIVSAAAALGNSSIAGTAVTKVDASGATPASISSGTLTISAPIPSPVPAAGLSLMLPATPATVGPFTASGGAISLTVDPTISLGLNVSGSTLNLTCNPYPNNDAATGIVTTPPSGAKAAPVIATASAGGAPTTPTTAAATPTTAAATPTTAAATPTTAAPATSPANSSLATTGPGPDLWVVALIGFAVLYLGSVALAVVERPRSMLRRLLHLQHPIPAVAAPVALPTPVTAVPAQAPPPATEQRMTPPAHRETGDAPGIYPRAGSSSDLWFDGCEPEGRNRS